MALLKYMTVARLPMYGEINNWNLARQKEFTTRVFNHLDDCDCDERTVEYAKYKCFKKPISNK